MTKVKEDGWNNGILHYAAASGSKEAVQVLLDFGADPLAKNFAGNVLKISTGFLVIASLTLKKSKHMQIDMVAIHGEFEAQLQSSDTPKVQLQYHTALQVSPPWTSATRKAIWQ